MDTNLGNAIQKLIAGANKGMTIDQVMMLPENKHLGPVFDHAAVIYMQRREKYEARAKARAAKKNKPTNGSKPVENKQLELSPQNNSKSYLPITCENGILIHVPLKLLPKYNDGKELAVLKAENAELRKRLLAVEADAEIWQHIKKLASG